MKFLLIAALIFFLFEELNYWAWNSRVKQGLERVEKYRKSLKG